MRARPSPSLNPAAPPASPPSAPVWWIASLAPPLRPPPFCLLLRVRKQLSYPLLPNPAQEFCFRGLDLVGSGSSWCVLARAVRRICRGARAPLSGFRGNGSRSGTNFCGGFFFSGLLSAPITSSFSFGGIWAHGRFCSLSLPKGDFLRVSRGLDWRPGTGLPPVRNLQCQSDFVVEVKCYLTLYYTAVVLAQISG